MVAGYHKLHSWEYRLLGKGVASQEDPDWTERTRLTLCLPPSKNPGTLLPSSDVYTASAGDSHTANFADPSAYTSVKWYVKSPSDTSDRGTLVETDTGNGRATTASLDYTFAADAAAGVYVITASVTTRSGTYEVSYKVTLSTVPGAPTIKRVKLSSDTSVLVSWSAPASDGGRLITDYEYRYQLSDATKQGSWINAGSNLSKSIRGLTPGASYTTEARAKNSIGYSVASPSYAFKVPAITPGFAPALGSSYTATAGETHIGEVRNSSLSLALLYVNGNYIERVWGSPTTTRLLLRYTFPENVSKSYKLETYVYAHNGKSFRPLGSYSYKVEVSAPQTVPSVPLLLSAEPNDSAVRLSWKPPADDGNSDITHYEYRYGIGESVTVDKYKSWTSMKKAMAMFLVSPLTNDISHIFEVRAVNVVGHSDPSASVRATPKTLTIPGKPTGLTATPSKGTVTLGWVAPTHTGGGIDTYEYRVDPNNDGSWLDWKSLNTSGTSATLNLQNGRIYGIQVRAKNSAGRGVWSTTVTAMPVDASVPVPSAPRKLSVTAEDGQVRLSWDAPATGSGIIDYEYKFDTDDDGSWRAWRVTDSTTTSYIVDDLTNGTVYAFKVRARNPGGAGSESGKVTATPTDVKVPGKTRNLTAALRSNGTVYLDWDAPTDDGGSAITNYEYIIDTNDDGSWGSWKKTGDTRTDEYLFECTRGQTYAFKVRAQNKVGAGRASDKATLTIPAIKTPSAPQDLTANAGNASVYLTWSQPAGDGYGGIRGEGLKYQYRYKASDGSWRAWRSEQVERDVTISGLTNGIVYQFEVRATNESGSGTVATVSATPTKIAVPGVPLAFDTFSENGAVDLWWDPPVYDGGSPITGYEHRYKVTGGSWNNWASAGNAKAKHPNHLVTGLINGTTYQFQVRACNKVGHGASTETLSETPKAKKPDAPTGLSAAAGSTAGSIVLTWTAPDANGSAITGYKYMYCKYDNGWKSWTQLSSTRSTSTSYTVKGLETGEAYRFRVAATNSVGDSRASKVAQANAP